MVAYTMPQKRKKEENERLRGEITLSLLVLNLKDGKFKIQECKKARCSINCMF